MWVLQHDTGGGWETTVSFGVALYAPGDTDRNFQIFATHTEKHNAFT